MKGEIIMSRAHTWLSFSLPAIIVLLLLFSLTACKSGNNPTITSTSSTTLTTTQTSVSKFTVTISNFAFSPAQLNINTGDTVTWTNKDGVNHPIVSDTANIFNSGNLDPNATFSYTFTTAGTYKYHCSIHPSMTGTITVK